MNPTDLVEAFHQELLGSADTTALDRYVAPDARTVMTGSEGSTIEVMRADIARYFGAFADVSTEIVDLVGAAGRVVLVVAYERHSHRPVRRHRTRADRAQDHDGGCVDFYRVAGIRISEVRSLWDAAGVYRQFGLLADHL